MRTLFVFATIALLCAPAGAGPEAPATWEPKVGTPARADLVHEARIEAFSRGYKAVRELAAALGTSGGRAAAEGLADILHYQGRRLWGDYRVATLRAACSVDLRSARLMSGVRSCLDSDELELHSNGLLMESESVSELFDTEQAVAPIQAVRHTTTARLRCMAHPPR